MAFRRANNQTRQKADPQLNSFDAASLRGEIEEWVSSNRPMLGELLLEESLDAEQLTNALWYQHEHGGRLGEILLHFGVISEHQIAHALARQFEIPLADLLHDRPDPEAIDLVDADLARKHHVVPYRVMEDQRVQIVTADPLDTDAIEELTTHCHRIALLVGAPSEIQQSLDQAYDELRDAEIAIKAFELSEEPTLGVEDGDNQSLGVDDNAPVVQVVNRIITQGVRERASDIHIEPTEKDVRVRFRVDGAMSEAIRLPARMASPLTSRIKVLAELNIVERRRPQDGQFSATVDGRAVDIRTSTVATIHGEKIVLRLLDKQRSLIGLDELGMPPEVIAPYLKIVKAPLGMLLCTGPTGSGKTTTLYATLAQVNDQTRNTVTIEDPVEYEFDGINQMQISDAGGITFAEGLRGILRQDPDVILLGEIRDVETASIAMQASLTGHFVLSSMHAVDAVAALHRFTDMGLEPFLVASAVNGVVGQRLLRRVCEYCKEVFRPPSDQVRLVAAQLGTNNATFARGTGCNQCSGTGYRGRIGVYELLVVSDKIRELIVDKATHSTIRKVAVQEGMRTMQYEAFQLVANGVTTVEEVIRSVYAPGVDLDVDPLGELMPGKRELPAGARALREAAEAAEGGEAYTSGEGDGEPGATVADVEVDVRETTPSAPWEVGA
jgi:type IV pilus assembly protein PilB